MTKKELQFIEKVLEHIKNPDANVALALAYIDKNIKQYEATRGQLKAEYDYDSEYFGFGGR